MTRKTALRLTGIVILVLILGMVACIPLVSTPRPQSAAGKDVAVHADTLARAMERAINKKAWDKTAYVRFNFLGRHDLLWDKKSNRIRVSWGAYTVYINGSNGQGRAWKKEKELTGTDRDKALANALSIFYNDTFWLNAPAKAFDEGVERGLVFGKDGSAGLLLTYNIGGDTPGDTYLWKLNTTGLPVRWNIWVEVLPIKGLRTDWDDWETLYSGALISTGRGLGPFHLNMIRDLAAAPTLEEMGEAIDAMSEERFVPVE